MIHAGILSSVHTQSISPFSGRYVGAVGVINYHSRVFLDETGDPPWPPVTDGSDEEDSTTNTANNDDDDDDRPVALGDAFPPIIDAEPGAAANADHAIN